MAFSTEPSIWALTGVLLLTSAACDSTPSNMPAPTPPATGPAAGAGSSGMSGGAAARSGGAGSAGSRVVVGPDDTMQGGMHAGSGGAGAGGSLAAGSAAAAGSGGAAGAAGAAAGVGGAGSSGTASLKPKCKSSPDQVIVLGDSYINWLTHSFPDDLAREAGETWRMYAVGGCSLGSGGLCLIPPQLEQAIADDPDIIAGVMTGGGNDILIADEAMFSGSTECKDRADSASVQVCQDVVTTAITAGEKLMQDAADAGMRDVIYMFYPHIPGGGFGGMNPNVLLDYALPKAKKLCDEAAQRTEGKLRCHFIDLVPIFEGHADWFADDGIHENMLGSAAMAKEVVRVVKAECVAQPASSGCCEP